jgi:14-3-3 protein epsilon
MADAREKNVYFAKLAEQAERYDEMADYMAKVGSSGAELSVEERTLLSVAYKNAVGSRRAAWRIITSVKDKEASKGNKEQEGFAAEYCAKVEGELDGICDTILGLLDGKLVGEASGGESKVFYQKMKADYYRYIAEYAKGALMETVKQNALKAYNEANQITLPPCNPIKLGLALKFSVFHYEVMKNHKAACELADQALQDALEKIDDLQEDDFRDAKSIIELLKENLTLWKEEEEGGDNQIDDL